MILDREAGDPTPEQIRIRAEQIRRGWSERVREGRRRRKVQRWLVPEIRVAEIQYDEPAA